MAPKDPKDITTLEVKPANPSNSIPSESSLNKVVENEEKTHERACEKAKQEEKKIKEDEVGSNDGFAVAAEEDSEEAFSNAATSAGCETLWSPELFFSSNTKQKRHV
tara:strand:- start:62 stop:382 length:321 start_codon:yes stop_codon:yes gene_type:complete